MGFVTTRRPQWSPRVAARNSDPPGYETNRMVIFQALQRDKVDIDNYATHDLITEENAAGMIQVNRCDRFGSVLHR
jgi:hypothetical protein